MKRIILMVSLLLYPRLLVAQDLDIKSLLGEDWYGLYLNGQKAGYCLTAVAQEPDHTVSVTEDAHFRMSMVGMKQDMRVTVKRFYAADGPLLRIDQEVEDVGGPKQFNARVEGAELVLVSKIAGATTESRVPKPKESLKDAVKQAELVGKNAKIGDTLNFSVFEPMFLKELDGVCTIEGVEQRIFDGVSTKVFKVKSTIPALGMDSITYVAENGHTLEDNFMGVITMRLEPKEMAQDVAYNNDVIVSNAAMIDKPLDNPRERDTLHLRIQGPLTADLMINDERQQLVLNGDGAEFASKRVSLEGFKAAQLPITTEDVAAWIKPSLLVQSDDPKLIAKAKEIVGGEKDAFAISTKLCHWVHDNVRTTYSARLSNALEVLEHPEGDCTEHSILFIGLARAAGLPAREVAGLIYVGDNPGFYFHQWAMVWVGKWIDVDPTFNQPLADVTHIKLSVGDLFEQTKIVPVIGKLQIQVQDGEGKKTP